jgi:hypothetical protein
LIDYLNSSDDLKLTLKLGKMMFFLLLYLHFGACLWMFVCLLGMDTTANTAELQEESGCKYIVTALGIWEPYQWPGYKTFMGLDPKENFYCSDWQI